MLMVLNPIPDLKLRIFAELNPTLAWRFETDPEFRFGHAYRVVAGPSGTSMPPLVPWFVAAFAVLVAINSADLIPAGIQQSLQTLSTWVLVISMSAIGMKAYLKDLPP